MQKIHFFLLHNRLGLITKPIGQKEFNIGVEDAPQFLVTPTFVKQFQNAAVDTFVFSHPEDIAKDTIQKVLFDQMKQAYTFIHEKMKTNEMQVVVGGDHSVTFPSFLSILKRYKGKKIGYVQFDSHGDMNLYKDSPTKNFHGMYVRPFIAIFDVKEIDNLVKKKLPKEHVWFIGNLDLDTKEKAFFVKSNIKNTTTKDMRKKKEVLQEFAKFIQQFDHIHITIDVDVFDKSQVMATGIPAQHGFLWKDIRLFVTLLKKHPSISVDMTEVNPKKKGAAQTIHLAQKMLTTLLLQKE